MVTVVAVGDVGGVGGVGEVGEVGDVGDVALPVVVRPVGDVAFGVRRELGRASGRVRVASSVGTTVAVFGRFAIAGNVFKQVSLQLARLLSSASASHAIWQRASAA